ncbi:MAG: hypothetical protein J1E59_09310 [Treponema sp.]|nr:hypothetical protein [Treponema sp.]
MAKEKKELTKAIIEGAFKEYKELRKKPNARALSWEHCISQFAAAFANPKKSASDEKTVDLLSLHLGFYLASWGMERNSKLMDFDYKIHAPFVRVLLGYSDLFRKDLADFRDPKAMERFTEMHKAVEKHCSQFSEAKSYNASDILVSKIILGTLGIAPAYDRNVKKTVKKYGISSGTFSPTAFKELAHYFTENCADITERMTNEMQKLCPHYTRAKVIDGILWILGRDA